jgi:hypothetical protein
MAATIKVKDLLYRVSVLLNDFDPQWVSWPENELVNWANDGQLIITTFAPPVCSRVDSIKLKAGTRQSIEAIAAADCLPGDGSTPSSTIYGKQFLRAVRNMGANGTTPGKAIIPGDMKRMDANSANWHTIVGEVRQVFFDPQMPKYFYVSKGVAAGSPNTWIEIAYIAAPALIPNTGSPGSEVYSYSGSSTTVISIDDECADPLVNYIMARAREKDQSENKNAEAGTYAALFTAWLNAKAAALTGHNPNLKRLPMAPAPLAAAS